MKSPQLGQTMAEYLVVALALVSAFYWASAAECAGYDNCLAKLKTVMHDKYEGYSNSISAVHQYGELKGEGFDAPPPQEPPGDGGDEEGNPDIEIPGVETPALARSRQIVSADGSLTYGTLRNGTEVVDGDGNVVGTYNPADGTVTLKNGQVEDALVAQVVTDSEGNPVPVYAITDCDTGEVYGFAYKTESDGKHYDILRLKPMEIPDGRCEEKTTPIVDVDGSPKKGAVVNGNYYAVIERPLTGMPIKPNGEVVWFNHVEVPDESPYLDVDTEVLTDCAVLVVGWEDLGSGEALDVYYNVEGARIGSAPGACG